MASTASRINGADRLPQRNGSRVTGNTDINSSISSLRTSSNKSFGSDLAGKCPGIKKAHPDVFSYVYIAPFKPFIEQTAVGYDIGGKITPPPLSPGLPRAESVVYPPCNRGGTEGQAGALYHIDCPKALRIHRISLSNGDIFVCLHILSGKSLCYALPAPRRLRYIHGGPAHGNSASSGPHFQHTAPGLRYFSM